MKKTHKHPIKTNTKTRKNKIIKDILVLKSTTPREIVKVSNEISADLEQDKAQGIKASYAPTINDELVSLKSATREKLEDCNNTLAFQMKEPLKIAVPGSFFGNTCMPYDSTKAQRFLLRNLSANKHIDPSKIITPVQHQSNCWFNTMFVTLFISDKGRKFFHYFRQLMIQGKQSDGSAIPKNLKDPFSLLNFAIECSLTGNKYAYEMDTNTIIKQIYDSIPDKYHKKMPYVVDVNKASNPIRYYNSIINYLNNNSIQTLFIGNILDNNWKSRIKTEIKKTGKKHAPHIIILEISDGLAGSSGKVNNKVEKMEVNGIQYVLDSCVVRDVRRQHFCATIVCEGHPMGYDGMSFRRLVPMKWRDILNSTRRWTFEGTRNPDGTLLEWSFLHGYQMLIYYRV